MRVSIYNRLLSVAAMLGILLASSNTIALERCQGTISLFASKSSCDRTSPAIRNLFSSENQPRAWLDDAGGRSRTSNEKTTLIKLDSKNAQLSDRGPDNPAKLVVTCTGKRSGVFLEFPGYKMSGDGELGEISYSVDGSTQHVLSFDAASNPFALGLPLDRIALSFIRNLVSANTLSVHALSAERTRIHADFDVSKLEDLPKNFYENCGT